MPDITMCLNKQCNKKDRCYRYTAIPDKWQSYANFENHNNNCEYYWENNDYVKTTGSFE